MRFVLAILVTLLTIGICAATISTPIIPSGPATGSPGVSYGYYTNATDSDGLSLRYTYDWGDGTSSISPLVLSGSKVKMFHKWTVAGSYSLRTKATNSAGLVSAWSAPLQVVIGGGVIPPANSPPATPEIPDGELIPRSGLSFSYSTKAVDPDGDTVQYKFDWGDGTTSATSWVSSGTRASAKHVWTIAPGTIKTFYIVAKATDKSGKESGWSKPHSVKVVAEKENHPPTMPSKPSGLTSGISGKSYTFSSSATDIDGDYLKYTFDWGDGSTITNFVPSGQVVSASHSWDNVPAGKTWIYKVRVFCVDSKYEWCPYPYWSDPLEIAIKGPSILTQLSGLKAEGDETVFVRTEEANAVDVETNESYYGNVSPLEA